MGISHLSSPRFQTNFLHTIHIDSLSVYYILELSSNYAFSGLPWWLRWSRMCLQCRRPGLIPESGRFPGGGNGYPPKYCCLENSMDRGAWWTTVHGVVESDTTEWLVRSHTHTHTLFLFCSSNCFTFGLGSLFHFSPVPCWHHCGFFWALSYFLAIKDPPDLSHIFLPWSFCCWWWLIAKLCPTLLWPHRL